MWRSCRLPCSPQPPSAAGPPTGEQEGCSRSFPGSRALCLVLPPLHVLPLISFFLHTVPSSPPPLKAASASSPLAAPDGGGTTPAPRRGTLALMLRLYCASFVFRASRSRSCPVCFDELLSALILSQSLTTHLQVCNLLLIIHFMRRTG